MPDEARGQTATAAGPAATECDVLVIGGGPAGSSFAAVFAERGRDVVVIEKEQHPRFHIGESLLPANLKVFERLGLSDAIRAMGVYKPGAEIQSDRYGKSNTFFFASAGHLTAPHSYHVWRADFDKLLFDNCKQRGARTVENTRVVEVDLETPERPTVRAVGPDGAAQTWRPRFVVDASGRDTVMAGKLGLKHVNKRNNTAAIFGHFKDVPARDGTNQGVITIHLVAGGWFWMIPLPDDVMSVGLVASPGLFKNRKSSIDELFWSTVRSAPSVAERMAAAKPLNALTTTGNYSYKTRPARSDRFMLIGDAFTFIDPIFSSGVMIAMTSGVLGAETIDKVLDDPRTARRALAAYDRDLRLATDTLAWLIYRINDPVLRHMLMNPQNRFRMRDGLIALLAGELFVHNWSLRFPMLLFKAVYYALSAVHRLTSRPDGTSPALVPAPVNASSHPG